MKPILFLVLTLAWASSLFSQTATSDCEQAEELVKSCITDPPSREKTQTLTKAASLCPESSQYQFILGAALEAYQREQKNPKFQAAMDAYEKALTLDPGNTGALFQLAGLEYLHGYFNEAKEKYIRFQKLSEGEETDQFLLDKAEEMIVKCTWLASLRAGSVKFAILHQDYGKFDASLRFVGNVSKEVGLAATQITNNLNFWGGGLAIALVADLIASEKEVDFAGLEKAQKKGNHAKIYQISRSDLANLINMEGINSERVQVFLENILVSGQAANISNKELAPYALAVAYYAEHPNPEFSYSPSPESRYIANHLFAQYSYEEATDYPAALAHYQKAREILIETYGGTSSNEGLILHFDYRILSSRIRMASSGSLEDLNEIARLLGVQPSDSETRSLIAWAFFEWAAKAGPDLPVSGFITAKSLVGGYAPGIEIEESKVILDLAWARLLVQVGEILHATDVLANIQLGHTAIFTSSPRIIMETARIYALLGKDVEAGNLTRLAISQMPPDDAVTRLETGILVLKNESKDSALVYWTNLGSQFYRKRELKHLTILPSFTRWMLGAGRMESLDSLFIPFEARMQANLSAEALPVDYLIQVFKLSDHNNPRTQVAYNRIEKALSGLQSGLAGRWNDDLRYFWMLKNEEYAKALQWVVVRQKGNVDQPGAETTLRNVADPDLHKSAFLLFKLGRHEECLRALNLALEAIQPHKDIFPDNLALVKTRIAVVYEAMGKKAEAERMKKELGAAASKISGF